MKTIIRNCPPCKALVKIQKGTQLSFGAEIFLTTFGSMFGSSLDRYGDSNKTLKCEACQKELMLWMPVALCLIIGLFEAGLIYGLYSELYGWICFFSILPAVLFAIFFNLFVISQAFQVNILNKPINKS